MCAVKHGNHIHTQCFVILSRHFVITTAVEMGLSWWDGTAVAKCAPHLVVIVVVTPFFAVH